MKNFFGLVPGAVYGWPKNTLHMLGIARSVVELNRIFSKSFAIVDGIVGMEGTVRCREVLNRLAYSSWAPTSEPSMLLLPAPWVSNPARIDYIEISSYLGNATESAIEQRGERLADLRTDFRLIREFEELRSRRRRHGFGGSHPGP